MSSAPNEVVPGPTSRQFVANVVALRNERGWTREALSTRLGAVGRPIRATGLARLEAGRRRVDVDDLLAFSLVFGVTPLRLLLPVEVVDEVALTEERSASWIRAWLWAVGEMPLDVEDNPPPGDRRVAGFIRDNRPFEDAATTGNKIARWLASREKPPFTAHVHVDKDGRSRSWIKWGSDETLDPEERELLDLAVEEGRRGQHREAP